MLAHKQLYMYNKGTSNRTPSRPVKLMSTLAGPAPLVLALSADQHGIGQYCYVIA